MRSSDRKIAGSMPNSWVIIEQGESVSGQFSALEIYNPNELENIEITMSGVRITPSQMQRLIIRQDGQLLLGHYTYISIPAGNGTKIVAYSG